MTQRRAKKQTDTGTQVENEELDLYDWNDRIGIFGEMKPGAFPTMILGANLEIGVLLKTHIAVTADLTDSKHADVIEDMRASFPHEYFARLHKMGVGLEWIAAQWRDVHRKWAIFTIGHGMEMYIHHMVYEYLHPKSARSTAELQKRIRELDELMARFPVGSRQYKDLSETLQVDLTEYCRLLTGKNETLGADEVTELASTRAKALSGMIRNAKPDKGSESPLDRDTFISLVTTGQSGKALNATATPFRRLNPEQTLRLFPEVRSVEHIRTAAHRRRTSALEDSGGLLDAALPIADRAQMWPRFQPEETA